MTFSDFTNINIVYSCPRAFKVSTTFHFRLQLFLLGTDIDKLVRRYLMTALMKSTAVLLASRLKNEAFLVVSNVAKFSFMISQLFL